jgi:hypothetical protein
MNANIQITMLNPIAAAEKKNTMQPDSIHCGILNPHIGFL